MPLVTIEKIDSITPHPNADRLEFAQILGYQCIVPIGKYNVGETIVFVYPDTVFPDSDWAVEYKKYAQKRVRAIKIRGVFSEGIIVPRDHLKEFNLNWENIGEEISEVIGVIKYEAPIPKESKGSLGNMKAQGILPYQLRKTDEDRWESLRREIPYGEIVDVSLKIDGTSATYLYSVEDDKFCVTSRQFEMKMYDSEGKFIENVYNRIALDLDIENKLKTFCNKYGVSLAIRGEIYGQGIQRNKYNPHAELPLNFAMFSVWLPGKYSYAHKGHQFYYPEVAKELGIPHVPMLEEGVELTPELIKKYSVDMETLDGKHFEGVVVKGPRSSFKIISKLYDSLK